MASTLNTETQKAPLPALLLQTAPGVPKARPQQHWRQARWYDATPPLAHAIELLELLPAKERFGLLSQVLQQEPWLHAQLNEKLQNKVDVVAPSFSENAPSPQNLRPSRRRWSDGDPLLKSVLHYCSNLPPALQNTFGQQLLEALKQL
jgi:hypothetical protein